MPEPIASGPVPRIVPTPTDRTRQFWTGGSGAELLIDRCASCRLWHHPPTDTCPACGGEVVAEPVSGRGTVFTFTVNRHPFNPSVPVPYVIALVELIEQDGLRLMANLVECDPDSVAIGMPVHVAFEHHGEVWVPVFVPD